ncbi:ATP-binding protein [Streptomyces sp. NBC_00988]|uniref:ATP-binding protein n=1 Tax=Streptomyces sp. NBC_00988 TaxID=2903704 RepID=UPI00386E0DA3|nr:ATP-binding protein [Streptomyces sp. NBC_00988]
MSADDVTPIPLLASSVRLNAVPQAVAATRLFVRHTLTLWDLEEHVETVALIMSELATNAVLASITDAQARMEETTDEVVIGAQIRAIEASLFVEVYDRTSAVPVRRNPDQDAEGGRGLLLVDVLAKQWNVYRPSVGGKIVWAELPLGFALEPFHCHYEHMPLLLPQGLRAKHGPAENLVRRALLDCLLKTTLQANAAMRMTDAT